MKIQKTASKSLLALDRRLAAYLSAAGAIGATMATDAHAIVVGNSAVQPFGINGEVNLDFNQGGQTDFQIDHDRVTLPGGTILDYLQIDENDINGASNPLAFDPGPNCCFAATPFSDGITSRNDANEAAYVITGPQGSYPAALTAGTPISLASTFDFQEGDNFQGSGKWIRANRLIDEDASQYDQVVGGRAPSGIQIPFSGPNFVGLGGEVRYVGLKMDLNDTNQFNYGWVGLRITNEADATGEVVGYAYETAPGVAIPVGTVPEPSSIITALIGAFTLVGCFLRRRIGRR